MAGIFGLFDLLALLYVFRSIQLAVAIWRERQLIKHPLLTRRNKHLAEQASFFIAVPVGVLVHELGHALATWSFGGRVVEFGYRAFWGYVVPQGSFTPIEDWFISLAGTLGSLLFGVGIWLLFRRQPNPTLHYFGLRAFRFQIFFSLVYYPIFTLIGFVGDWRTIYDFSQTPLASAVTLLAHATTLWFYWRLDRSGFFEMISHGSESEREKFALLTSQVAGSPQEPRLQLRIIETLGQGGALKKARHMVDDFVVRHPDSAEGFLLLADLQRAGKSQIPRATVENAKKALSLGLAEPAASGYAHQLLGKYYLDLGDGNQAESHLGQAIAYIAHQPANARQLAQLYHWRSQAYRRLRSYELAYQDVSKAISLAQAVGDDTLASFYQSELGILEHHAGRPLEIPTEHRDESKEVM